MILNRKCLILLAVTYDELCIFISNISNTHYYLMNKIRIYHVKHNFVLETF